MSKRPAINVFFPDEAIREDFKKLCAKAKVSMSSRAISLIRRDIATWLKTGEIEEIKDEDLTIGLDQLVRQHWLDLAEKSGLQPIRLQDFVSGTGSLPTWVECNLIAEVLDMDVDEIQDLAEKLYKKEENNHESSKTTRT